jgi:hypothetical protein
MSPLFPWLAQNVSGFEIDEQAAGLQQVGPSNADWHVSVMQSDKYG